MSFLWAHVHVLTHPSVLPFIRLSFHSPLHPCAHIRTNHHRRRVSHGHRLHLLVLQQLRGSSAESLHPELPAPPLPHDGRTVSPSPGSVSTNIRTLRACLCFPMSSIFMFSVLFVRTRYPSSCLSGVCSLSVSGAAGMLSHFSHAAHPPSLPHACAALTSALCLSRTYDALRPVQIRRVLVAQRDGH